jgi:hypothetical protein
MSVIQQRAECTRSDTRTYALDNTRVSGLHFLDGSAIGGNNHLAHE